MNFAYKETDLYNLVVIKKTKRWFKQGFITEAQQIAVHSAYPSAFYHPNLIIRILLFIATLLALSGVSGILGLMFASMGENVIKVLCVMYGIASFYFLKKIFIENNKHYKSGVTEALLYHACGFVIGGVALMTDFNMYALLLVCLVVFSFAAIRYLDLITTLAATCSFGGVLFFACYDTGGLFRQIIPFVIMISFLIVYVLVKRIKKKLKYKFWINNLMVIESVSLLLVYAVGNYFVVRELSVDMMDLQLQEGQEIPFAFLFYAFTVLTPIALLFFGIRNKDIILLRVSLVAMAFSVFTFKYYYGFGHPEITLTLAGAVLLGVSILLFTYLKTVRHGFTRENHLAEKWGNLNLQAFIVSQTLGGNQVVPKIETGEGGKFGGGGSTDSF